MNRTCKKFLHIQIVLEPLNPAYQPIELRPESEEDVKVIAEWLAVLE